MRFLLDHLPSPLSTMFIVTDGECVLRAVDFHDYEPRMRRLLRDHYGDVALEAGAAPNSIAEAFGQYFEGNLHALDDVATATGGTLFQREVWQALRSVAAGMTQSYRQIAAAIGRPSATRAVGAANGANPLALVVPCHRVIGASGKLTGYGGGLARKQWLLDHERRFASVSSTRERFESAGTLSPRCNAC